MSKAQARRGSGGRSGAARAGASGKNGRAAGSAGSRTAGSGRAGSATASGKQAGGGAQRNQGNGTQRSQANGPRPTGSNGTRPTAASKPATPTAKAPVAQAAGTATPVRGKRWLLGMNGIEASTLILSVIGLGVAIYATILHYDSNIVVACPATGAIDCQAVMTSSQSVVFGIFPVAVLGMAFFLFMIAINSPWAWRGTFPAALDRFGGRALNSRPELIRWTRLGSIIVGMGFAIYLIFAELVQIQKICLWCTSVHLVTFLLFVIIVFNASFSWGKTDATRA
jgi:uncharacterized membrane protein